MIVIFPYFISILIFLMKKINHKNINHIDIYNFLFRCKVFSNLPSICTLKPDPADSCCEQPDCGTYSPIIGNTITGTPPPNKLNIIPIGTHTVFSGSSQNPKQITGTRGMEHYVAAFLRA